MSRDLCRCRSTAIGPDKLMSVCLSSELAVATPCPWSNPIDSSGSGGELIKNPPARKPQIIRSHRSAPKCHGALRRIRSARLPEDRRICPPSLAPGLMQMNEGRQRHAATRVESSWCRHPPCREAPTYENLVNAPNNDRRFVCQRGRDVRGAKMAGSAWEPASRPRRVSGGECGRFKDQCGFRAVRIRLLFHGRVCK